MSVSTDSHHAPGKIEQIERALIDASARVPVLTFFFSAVFWLLVQTALGVVVAVKALSPDFLGGCSWLTFGRVYPVQINLMVYGWATLAGVGVALWILARLCRVALPRPSLLVCGTLLWNIAVAAGSLEILAGNGRGIPYLDYPAYIFAILFAAYCLVAVWGVILFIKRRPGHVFISAWYLVAALFWFPWLIGGANLLFGSGLPGSAGVQGVMQAVVGAWYAQGLINLWLGAVGLGAIYYLIPKVVGRPVHSYSLALVGFWSFAIFAVWTGGQRLSGGPVPAWIITVGVFAAILMLIPTATITANYFMTMVGRFNLVYHSPTVRFVFFGACAWTVANVVYLLSSFRTVSNVTQFTWFTAGVDQLFIFSFFTMVMFGSMYYIIPRLTGCEWLSGSMIKLHFWGSAYGWGLLVFMLLMAGYAQGDILSQAIEVSDTSVGADFMLSLYAAQPYLRGAAIAQVLICFAQFIFSVHFLLMLLRLGRPSGVQPTLLAPITEGAKS